MRRTVTLCFTAMLSLVLFADELVLPTGMIDLLPAGVTTTATYLAENIKSVTKCEKPVVVTSDNYLVFTATDEAHGEELWISDGTVEGTHMIADIVEGAGGCDPKWLTVVGENVFFQASTAENGAELWKTDGTASGTKMVKDIYEGVTGSAPQGLTNYYGKLLFFAMDEVSETLPVRDAETPEKWLWISDGTADGTYNLAETPTRMDDVSGTCGYIVTCNGKALFIGYNEEFNETMWVTEGTKESTKPLLNINPKPNDNAGNFQTGAASIEHMISVDDRLVCFRAIVAAELYGEDKGVEMWISDGTTEGTKWIGVDINPVESSGAPGGCDFRQTYAFGNMLYFRAKDGVYGAEAWAFNIDKPIEQGVNPRMVKDVAHDKGKVSYNAHPSCFYPYQGYVYTATNFSIEEDGTMWDTKYHSLARFNENNYDEYQSCYFWGGAEIYPGGSEWCHWFVDVRDILFWSEQDLEDNIELWKLEGTNGKPTKVVDFPENGKVSHTLNVKDALFFVSAGQWKLYRYNVNGSTDYYPTTGITNLSHKNENQFSLSETETGFVIHAEKEIASVELFDVIGLKVISSQNKELYTGFLNAGVYIVNVQYADGENASKKISIR